MIFEPPGPIEYDGIRYEAPFTEQGGRLVAREATTGILLWEHVIPDWNQSGSERAPQIMDLDFRGGRLFVADDFGREWTMDLVTREVRPWVEESQPAPEPLREIFTSILSYLKVTYGRTDWVVLQNVRVPDQAEGCDAELCLRGISPELYAHLTAAPTPEQWSRTLAFTQVAYDPDSGSALVGAYCATDLGRVQFRVDREGKVTTLPAESQTAP